VRGKTILWLTLIALLFGITVPNLGVAQTSATISVEPSLITGLLPGDSFGVDIYITDADAVHAWEVKLGYAPYMDIIVVTDIIEGDFLMGGGMTTFAKYVDHFYGFAMFGATGDADHYGVWGEGILATVIFSILEAGECDLDLYDTTLLNRDKDELTHSIVDGYYLGPTADLRKLLGTARGRKAPYTAPASMDLKAQVVNDGYADIYARLKFSSVHESGKTITLYSGQHLWTTEPREPEYYYVNEFTLWRQQWDTIGDEPWLGAIEDGNYIEGHNHGEWIGIFGFEDITLNPGDIISSVTMEAYTQAESGDTDYDVYDWNTGSWIDSWWGGADWSWHTSRWVDPVTSNIVPALTTLAGFNGFQIVIFHYGTFDSFSRLDALRLKVEFTGIEGDPTWEHIPVGAPPVDLPPAVWDIYDFDAGDWDTTVTCEYRYNYPDPRFLQVWQTAKTIETYSWSVK